MIKLELNSPFLFLLSFLFCVNLKAQEVYHEGFEQIVFQNEQDTAFSLKRYLRVGEVNLKKCTALQKMAFASAETSPDIARLGLNSGKVILNVSNGGVGHKAMFRKELLSAGTELRKTKDERWIGFSCYLPDTGLLKWEADSIPELIFQLHNDILASPMLAIYSQNDMLNIVYRYAKTDPHLLKLPLNKNVSTMHAWCGPAVKGHWMDWVFHIKFSPEDRDGFLEVWLNVEGEYKKIVGLKNIRIGYECSKETDLDIGVYKWHWKCPQTTGVQVRTMYIDEISIANGNGNFSSIALKNE